MILKGANHDVRQCTSGETPTMHHRVKRIPITDLNEHLTCTLCHGYFIDATTIIECLHSFCRSCIVKYLESNKYCPVCDVQVHKTKPLQNIRPDKTLQDIVYKLVPRLFQNETKRRNQYYDEHPESKPSLLEQRGEAAYQHLLSPDETICISFNYHGSTAVKRYLRCPVAVTVSNLQKLIRAKYDLTDNHRVDVFYNHKCLNSYLTLMDVAYIYLWRRKGPMELTYRIYENTAKRMKLEDIKEEECPTSNIMNNNNNNDWKEVQLRISENGEMSVTGIQDCLDILDEHCASIVTDCKQESDVVVDVKVEEPSPAPLPVKVEDPQPPEAVVKAEAAPPESILTVVAGPPATTVKATTSPPQITNVDVVVIRPPTPAVVKPVATKSPQVTSETKSSESSEKQVTESAEKLPEVKIAEPISETAIKQSSEKFKREPPALKLINSEKSKSCDSKTKLSTPVSKTKTKESGGSSKDDGAIPVVFEKAAPKRKLEESSNDGEPPQKSKPTVLNHAAGLQNLSNNHPLKKHSQMLNKKDNSVEKLLEGKRVEPPRLDSAGTVVSSTFTRPTPSTSSKWSKASTPGPPPCYVPKPPPYNPVINVPKVQPSTSNSKPVDNTSIPQISTTQSSMITNNKIPKPKPSSPMGYKTLRDPPKTWNPQIARTNATKTPDSKSVRPAKFFKMRNNLPRYLGNPASGVKPMYQVHTSPDKDKKQPEIKRHSIVKIDPKTLKPVSERAPETSSLSNHQDLKINTSSVPIFNPLKLQSSPKSDRKSPQSPKKSPPTKRDKVNVSYTPPNPFIPNLASPTINPNQFLYPSGPPGFPSYDPRVMAAAYHSLLYGQRLPFNPAIPPSLGLEMSRKTYDTPKTTKPDDAPKTPKPSSKSKSEKTLQNALEKLTQNKIRESIKNSEEGGKGTAAPSVKVDEVARNGDVPEVSDAKAGKEEAPSNNNV